MKYTRHIRLTLPPTPRWKALPTAQHDLLAGILVGREAGIGYNAWWYGGQYTEPNSAGPKDGNQLYEQCDDACCPINGGISLGRHCHSDRK